MSSKLTVTLFFSFLNISFLFPTSISGLNQEGVSLVSWLSTFNSSSASVVPFSSWNPSHVNPCKWDYIQCTSNGFVSDIKIRSINLPAIFPSQLLSFPFLEVLVLSNCNLTGEITASMWNLSSPLRILDLGFNAEIGRLSQLISISIQIMILQIWCPSLEVSQSETVNNSSLKFRIIQNHVLIFSSIIKLSSHRKCIQKSLACSWAKENEHKVIVNPNRVSVCNLTISKVKKSQCVSNCLCDIIW